MSEIGKLIESKELVIWSVSPEDSVFSAIDLMDKKGIGALVVLQDNKLVGIVSERDCARKVILKKLSSENTKVKEIMTQNVFYTQPTQTVNECLAIMTQKRIRHLPVMDNEQIIGIISLGDLAKEVIAEQQFKIESLEHSISWSENY